MNTVQTNSLRAWFLASRPKTLAAALSPVAIAVALAHSLPLPSGGAVLPPSVFWTVAALCLLFAAVMQVVANFINDLFDFRRGTDGEDRLGPERACAQGWVTPRAMEWGIALTLTLAAVAGVGILVAAAPYLSINYYLLWGIGLACMIFAFLYTTLLSYCGGGDVLVWVFFGLVPVMGTYYVLTGTVSMPAAMLAMATGLVTDTLLVLNNYRDRDTDRQAGKRTLVVVLGERFGEQFYLWQGLLGVFIAAFALGLHSLLPYILYMSKHIYDAEVMRRIKRGRPLNGILGRTAFNILLFALCTLCAIHIA